MTSNLSVVSLSRDQDTLTLALDNWVLVMVRIHGVPQRNIVPIPISLLRLGSPAMCVSSTVPLRMSHSTFSNFGLPSASSSGVPSSMILAAPLTKPLTSPSDNAYKILTLLIEATSSLAIDG